MSENVRLIVGTRKGAFIYTSDERRKSWQISEPIMPGWSVYHGEADTRGGNGAQLLLAANHWAWGPCVAKSSDGGKEWDWNSQGLGFAEDMGVKIGNIWEVRPGLPSEPRVLYAGTQPAGLFRSEDSGKTWSPVEGLNRHKERPYWGMSGGGDSCVNSIEIDPRDAKHMWVAVSSGGSYVTKDGGKTWDLFSHTAIPQTEKARAFTQQILADFPPQEPAHPDMDPMAINEMHKMRLDEKDPAHLWTQSHTGVFFSPDGGSSWEDVTHGLPSFHGFPIAVTRKGPDAAFVVPLEFEANNFRVCNGQFAVWRTKDQGKSWQQLTDGLPGPHDYQSVYRNALDCDRNDPAGVYVGTTNGQIYASTDTGDHWARLPGTLPPILSVTAV